MEIAFHGALLAMRSAVRRLAYSVAALRIRVVAQRAFAIFRECLGRYLAMPPASGARGELRARYGRQHQSTLSCKGNGVPSLLRHFHLYAAKTKVQRQAFGL